MEKVRRSGPSQCVLCPGVCSGFHPHQWSKVCVTCGCGAGDHAPGSDVEDDQRMGRLLADTPCSHLTTKVKGGGGLRMYKRNQMTVTNPVVSRKDPTFNTTTYEWAPAGLNQKLAMQYMEALPERRRPVSGTDGAVERRRQLLRQLPTYDHDPMKCTSLDTDDQISSMLLFVKHYKQEVLGVGEVALPGEGGALREAANQRSAKETKDKKEAGPHQDAADPTPESSNVGYVCAGCRGDVDSDAPAVFAQRCHGALWHPACFNCSVCAQGLVDLVYFWSEQRLFCGRHYCDAVRPRCGGCDELIFTQSFFTAKNGRTFHHHHYCCWKCGRSLDDPCTH